MKITYLVPLVCLVLLAGMSPGAFADTIGERHNFFVNPTYDISSRTSVPATLEYIGAHAYYYIEDGYLTTLNPSERQSLDQKLVVMSNEFDINIYAKETALFGFEANPGIDNDPRITIFLERLTTGTGGYFDSVNEYPPSQANNTNQREMIVANVLSLNSDRLKIFLAHEFQHLISFNQKELLHNVSEDTWLNELRSQYAITLDGYNDDYQNSDLRQRVDAFLSQPGDSVPEWPNTNIDYASVTLFGQYLVDRFGTVILQDTIRSPLVGIASINKWLTDHQQTERFGDVFGDWVWANFLNNRSADIKGGYANPNLQSIHVLPTASRQLNASTINSFNYSLKPFQPDWEQFLIDQSAPKKNIKITWRNSQFQVFYADATGKIRALTDGDIIPSPSVGTSFLLMPVNETKTLNFGTSEPPTSLALTLEYTDNPIVAAVPVSSTIRDGSLITHAGTPDIYVVTGIYKRYLAPGVLKFYGLDAAQAVQVSEAVFQSYSPTNYIRDINEKKVYAVWPDGTKHWLNMSAQTFTDSFRDWNSVFIVNDLESNFYKIGPDITQ